MKQGYFEKHWDDIHGNPDGGVSTGVGFTIAWQRGPLGEVGSSERCMPTGAFAEDVLDALIGRIEYYQQSRFPCRENEETLIALHMAADALARRTADRVSREVEGTHAP